MEEYKIVRFYKDRQKKEIIRERMSLEQAQEWCSREDTHKEGVWFDGYAKQDTDY